MIYEYLPVDEGEVGAEHGDEADGCGAEFVE